MPDDEIYRRIPHRPPFLFVDRIVAIDAESATAERTIREEEPQFEGHYPGNPIMPGVLLCEAVFQTGALFLMEQQQASAHPPQLTPVLSRIENARFKQMVKPGDRLTITAKLREKIGRFFFLDGSIVRDGKTVMTVGNPLALVEES
jgi:3-hydroxyacyl-[acyl-carrier-protein] dehydratase